MMRKLFLPLLAPVFLLLVFPFDLVFAGHGLSIQPAKIVYTLNKGEVATSTIRVRNVGDERVKVGVNAQDFIPVAGDEGYQIVHRAPGITTVSDWIFFGLPYTDEDFATSTTIERDFASTTEFYLEVGQEVKVPYVIKTPLVADPGSHFGVLLFNARDATPGAESNQLAVGARVGALTFVTVPGNRLENGKLLSFSAPHFVQKSPVNFDLSFENTGTVYFEPRGTIDIYNIINRKVGETPIFGRAILPTGVGKLTIPWIVDKWLFGRYLAKATVVSSDNRVLSTAETTFYAVPLKALAIFFGIIIVAFILLKLLRRYLNISISVKKE